MSAAETPPGQGEEWRAGHGNAEYYRDLKNSIDTAAEEGEARGEAKGLAEGEMKKALAVARTALAEGLPVPLVAKLTGLSEQEVAALVETAP